MVLGANDRKGLLALNTAARMAVIEKHLENGVEFNCIDGIVTVSYTHLLTAGDAAYIAKKLAEQKADELPETADFNGDGKITALDCAEIARFLAAKALARAEGMFVEQQ